MVLDRGENNLESKLTKKLAMIYSGCVNMKDYYFVLCKFFLNVLIL